MPVSVANANKKCGPSKSGPPYEQTGVFLSMPAERIRELSERTRKYIKERRITKDTLPALLSTGEETAAASGSLLTAGINGNPSDASLNPPVHGQPRNEVAEDGIQEKPVDGGGANTGAGSELSDGKSSEQGPSGEGTAAESGSPPPADITGEPSGASLNPPVHGQPRNEVAYARYHRRAAAQSVAAQRSCNTLRVMSVDSVYVQIL